MKTLKELMSESRPHEQTENVALDDQSMKEPLNENLVAGAVVSAKLSSMKNRVLNEDDLKKKIDILAQMIHFGIGMIALVTNDKRNRP